MVKEKIMEQIQSLSDEEMSQVLDFIKLLREQPEELTNPELEQIKAGQEEFARGEWSRWKDVKRDV
jgi:cytochrome c553